MDKYSRLSHQFFGSVKKNEIFKIEDCFVKNIPFVKLLEGCGKTGSEEDKQRLRRGRKRKLANSVPRGGERQLTSDIRCLICYSTFNRRDGFDGGEGPDSGFLGEFITLIKTCEDGAFETALQGVNVSTSFCLTCYSAAKDFIQLQKLIKRLEQEVFEMKAKFINAIKLSTTLAKEDSNGSRRQQEFQTNVDIIRKLLIGTTSVPIMIISEPDVFHLEPEPTNSKKQKTVSSKRRPVRFKNGRLRKPRRLGGGDYKHIKQIMENLVSTVERMVPYPPPLLQPNTSPPIFMKSEPEEFQFQCEEDDLITGDIHDVKVSQDIPPSPAPPEDSPAWSPPASPDPAWRPSPQKKPTRRHYNPRKRSVRGINHRLHSINQPSTNFSQSRPAAERRERAMIHPNLSQREIERLYGILAKPDPEERTRLEREFWDEMKVQQPDLDLERNAAFKPKKRRPRGIHHPGTFINRPSSSFSQTRNAERARLRTLRHPDLSQREIVRLYHYRAKKDPEEKARLEREFWEELKKIQPDLDLEKNGAFRMHKRLKYKSDIRLANNPDDLPSTASVAAVTSAKRRHLLRTRHPDLSVKERDQLCRIRAKSRPEDQTRLEREFWEELKAQKPDLDLEKNGAFKMPMRLKGNNHHLNNPPPDKLRSSRAATNSARRRHILSTRHPDLTVKERERLCHIRAKYDLEDSTRLEREFWDEMKGKQPDLDLERNSAFKIDYGNVRSKPKRFSKRFALSRRQLALKYSNLSKKEIQRLYQIRTKPDLEERTRLECEFWNSLKHKQPDLELDGDSASGPSRTISGQKPMVMFQKVVKDDGETIHLYKNIEVKEDKSRKVWTCGSCDYFNKLKSSVSKHINMRHQDLSSEGFKCEFCNRMFYYNHLLLAHVASSHPTDRVVCEECGETFATEANILMHKRVVHLKIKPHICEHCGKSFGRKKDRDLHVRRHTGERPFVCHVCAQAFFDNQSMKAHIRKRHPEAAKHLPPKANAGRSKNAQLKPDDDL